ncbi:MerC domain-containing protein, partial [Acinetobacter baumannii]
HCALLPLFISSIPLFGINVIENLLFEYWMIGLAFVVGVYALYHGYKKHHHSISPILLFSVGIILLLVKVNWHQWKLL